MALWRAATPSISLLFRTVRWSSSGDYCLGGITRRTVIDLCRDNCIPIFEKSFSLTDVYGADKAFVTGTFVGVVPVAEVDGRLLDERKVGYGFRRAPAVKKLQGLFLKLFETECASG